MKEVMVLFSGGKDSLLATVRYLDKGYKVYLVTYDNSYSLGGNNVLTTAKRLEERYIFQVVILGIKDISPIFRELIYPFYNYKTEYIKNNFGNITISQFNCLACRVAMYIGTILLCKEYKIKEVIDGARVCQLFVIEQKEMLQKFRELFHKYDLTINYPLENLESDWQEKNELLMRGIVPKTIEGQCLLGCPVTEEEITIDLIEGIIKVYDSYLISKIIKCLDDYKDIKWNGEYI